jgi:hypothetical protein
LHRRFASNAELSSPPAPPPPCFAWSPSPAIAGADEQAISFSRCARHPSCCHAEHFLRSPHRSSPENAGGGGRYLTIRALSQCFCWSMTFSENRYPLFRVMLCKKEEKRTAERRQTLIRIHRTFRYGARFAKRARPSAFHHGSDLRDVWSQRLTPGHASCRTALTRRVLRQPRAAVPAMHLARQS